MRFLTADYLYPLYRNPLKEGVLQISETGEIIDVFESRKNIAKEKLEIFNGILCPGFINAHCHLELSHLKGMAKKGKGLLDFIRIIEKRNSFKKNDILSAISKAENEMKKNGIVGVGDICNTNITISQKQKKNLQYYNFIEVFGVQDQASDQIILTAKRLKNEFKKIKCQATIVPHAPYSVSLSLMQNIVQCFDSTDELMTIHMQETESERILFDHQAGEFYVWLQGINANSDIWVKRNGSTDGLTELSPKKILLVHNTFSKKEDMTDQYYCSCPKANLYIENQLPDYSIFDTNKLCVGTDSLASNNNLSILEELQIIQENSDFDINTLLKIASKNGAEALGFKTLGTFEKGKFPGVNLISNFNQVTVLA